jgi:hypothetical protein
MTIGALLTNLVPDRFRALIPDRKQRSTEIFEPIHGHFIAALIEIQEGERASHLDGEFWCRLKSTDRVKVIKPDLRRQLTDIYETFGPRHDLAWREMNDDGLRTFMTHLAIRYGSRREVHSGGKFPRWRRFLCENTFNPLLLELPNNGDVQLWDRHFLDRSKVDALSPHPNRFLRACWYEAAGSAAFANVKKERAVLKREIVSALAQVKKHVIR